jgi:hypothetical protein
MGEEAQQSDLNVDELRQASASLDESLSDLSSSSSLVGLGLSSRQEVREAAGLIGEELGLLTALQDALSSATNALTDTAGILGGSGSEAPDACVEDSFQGIRFYDGTSFGYLRIKPDKVELLVDEPLEFELDGTEEHDYLIVSQNNDIKLYVDSVLAIDGVGKFGAKTTRRLIEFGDIAGRNQTHGSAWQSFRYSVTGEVPPTAHPDSFPQEILSVPDGKMGSVSKHKGALYTSFDPHDNGQSSCVYRVEEGSKTEEATTLAITRSNVSAVAVNPGRETDLFGTSGKYIGTDRGVQYVIGGKLDHITPRADMREAKPRRIKDGKSLPIAKEPAITFKGGS